MGGRSTDTAALEGLESLEGEDRATERGPAQVGRLPEELPTDARTMLDEGARAAVLGDDAHVPAGPLGDTRPLAFAPPPGLGLPTIDEGIAPTHVPRIEPPKVRQAEDPPLPRAWGPTSPTDLAPTMPPAAVPMPARSPLDTWQFWVVLVLAVLVGVAGGAAITWRLISP